MVWPILISVSLVPGPYCFCAIAGDASRDNAAAARIIPRADIRLPPRFFNYGGSVSERPHLGKQAQTVWPASIMLRCRQGRIREVSVQVQVHVQVVVKQRSNSWLSASDRLLVPVRPGRDMPARGGADVHRRARFGHRLRPEKYPAPRGKLGLSRDHAGRDAIDIRNCGTAEPEGITGAGLLLFVRIGPPGRRQQRTAQRDGKHQTEWKTPGPDDAHVSSPRSVEGANCG